MKSGVLQSLGSKRVGHDGVTERQQLMYLFGSRGSWLQHVSSLVFAATGGIFSCTMGDLPDPGLNPGLLYCRQMLYNLSHQGSQLECQSRKSKDTCSNRKIWLRSTEWSRAKVNRVLPREYTGHSKHPLPVTQDKTLHREINRKSISKSDSLYSLQLKMDRLYTVSKNKTRSWIWLRWQASYCKIQA